MGVAAGTSDTAEFSFVVYIHVIAHSPAELSSPPRGHNSRRRKKKCQKGKHNTENESDIINTAETRKQGATALIYIHIHGS